MLLSLPFSPLASPIVATFPAENLTAPGLIDTSSTPSPAFLSPLPARSPTHLSHFLSHLSSSHSIALTFLPCALLVPFGLLLVSSTQPPNLAFAHARLDSRPCFAHCRFRYRCTKEFIKKKCIYMQMRKYILQLVSPAVKYFETGELYLYKNTFCNVQILGFSDYLIGSK